MSRYQLDSKQYDICVGWDQPMRTFFAIVQDPDLPEDEDSDEDDLIAWIGNSYDSIKSVKQLQGLLTPYGGTIPKDIASSLKQDSKEPFTPSSLQVSMEKLFQDSDDL